MQARKNHRLGLPVLATATALMLFGLHARGEERGEAAARFDLGRLTLQAPYRAPRPDPFVIPHAVDVRVPTHVSSDLETGFNVLVSMPNGCYGSQIKVEHLDDYTHRLTPVLVRDEKGCIRYSRLEQQVVSLGRLLPGRHEIVVENTMTPVEPKTFWVDEADRSAANRVQKSTLGS